GHSGKRCRSRVGARPTQTIGWPRDSSSATMREPMKPPAPTTSIRIAHQGSLPGPAEPCRWPASQSQAYVRYDIEYPEYRRWRAERVRMRAYETWGQQG